jgi:hypothetical protein
VLARWAEKHIPEAAAQMAALKPKPDPALAEQVAEVKPETPNEVKPETPNVGD